MVTLIISILCSAAISVIMRIAQKYTKNNISMLVFNYVMCTVFACCFTLADSGSLVSKGERAGYAVMLGLINGCLYLSAFMLLQFNIRKNGVVLASTFMKLGVLVPTLAAVLFFGEKPSVIQILGFVLALAAIILINSKGKENRISAGYALILVLIAGGLADAMSKVFEATGNSELKNHFLLLTFFTALCLCIVSAFVKGQKATGKDMAFGLLLGIPNYLSSRLLLLSLSSVPAVIAYPTFSVGTIVLVSIVSIFAFREKLSTKQWAAIVLILLSLVLLNV